MLQYSEFTKRIAGRSGYAWGIHMDALKLRDTGQDVIMLTVGDPDQPPPEALIDTAVAALRAHHTGYSGIVGYPALRQAIAKRHTARTGRACAAENVVIVPGAQGGLFCALLCLAGPGDEVIVPEPVYATYERVIGAAGARMVTVPLVPERGFHPDLPALAAAVTPRTRVVWINSPHNPTGAVFTAEEITAIAERTVVVSSLSKSHAVPAFRLGWIIGPPELSQHLFDLLLCMTYGNPAFIQEASLAALMRELPDVAALREDYRARAARFSAILAAAPRCRVTPPEGGMFVLFDVRGTNLGSERFARGLLEREKVAVLPCDSFGPSGAGQLRIALSRPMPVLEDAGNRIVRYAQHLAQRPI